MKPHILYLSLVQLLVGLRSGEGLRGGWTEEILYERDRLISKGGG